MDEDEQEGNPVHDDDMVGGFPGMSNDMDMPDLAQVSISFLGRLHQLIHLS
jgi:hypothetical protein